MPQQAKCRKIEENIPCQLQVLTHMHTHSIPMYMCIHICTHTTWTHKIEFAMNAHIVEHTDVSGCRVYIEMSESIGLLVRMPAVFWKSSSNRNPWGSYWLDKIKQTAFYPSPTPTRSVHCFTIYLNDSSFNHFNPCLKETVGDNLKKIIVCS